MQRTSISRFLRKAIVALVVLSVVSCLLPGNVLAGQARYVFLFIGDGMGIPQQAAAEAYTNGKLIASTFPVQGITTTHANDRFITGSAAAATAMAAGQKTNIGFIGMDPGQRPVQSIAEMARDLGMKVGIVSSVSIDHATPAAFYAHVPSRGMYHEIDVALARSGFDFFGGGGLKDPMGLKSKQPLGDARIIATMNGYALVDNKEDFKKLKPGQKAIAWNGWLQDSQALSYHMDAHAEDITLPEFTAKAIELLDNPDGFFLMVEGGKIDWASHANDATAAIEDTLAFDRAVEHAVRFAKHHPEETLIVISGDHECGGMTLGFAGTKYETSFDILSNQKVSFTKFDQEVLAPFKKNHADNARFEDMLPLIESHFGLKIAGDDTDPMVLKGFEIAQIREAFDRSVGGESVRAGDDTTYRLYGGYEPLTVTLTHILNQKAGVAWTSYSHTGVPVSTAASGAGAELFSGYYDNTDVARKLMQAMGIEPRVYYSGQTVKNTRLALQ
ncbi:MAG: alkaline phosphatase [Desulfovibrionales bacterium]